MRLCLRASKSTPLSSPLSFHPSSRPVVGHWRSSEIFAPHRRRTGRAPAARIATTDTSEWGRECATYNSSSLVRLIFFRVGTLERFTNHVRDSGATSGTVWGAHAPRTVPLTVPYTHLQSAIN